MSRVASLLAVYGCVAGLVLTTAPCQAQLPPAAAANVEPSAEARQQFEIGVALLQDPDGARYEEAFKAFFRAYTATPSWKILGNLGLSAYKIERYVDGIEAYERYLAQAGDQLDPAEREQVRRDLDIMKATSGTLVLRLPGGASLEDTRTRSVGGPVVNSYTVPESGTITLRLTSGHHTLRAAAAGKSGVLDLDVKSGEKAEHTISLGDGAAASAAGPASPSGEPSAVAPAPARSSGMRTAGLVIGGVGVAALIGGGVTAFLGSNKQSDLESRCPDKRCEYSSPDEKASFESDRDSLKTMGTMTTVLLIGGGVLAATGATLFVVGGSSKEPQVAATASFAPGVFGLSARGSF